MHNDSAPVCTRFAPSPTGYMHIGNLRTALYAWLLARSTDGKFIVRIEDTDRERLVEGAVDVILDTLRVTGLDYDEGPVVGGPNGPYVQSKRKPIYKEYAEKLISLGHAYYCFCTPERLASLHEDNENGGYDRHCRNLPAEEVRRLLDAGTPYVVRQKIPLDGTTTYVDEVFGEISMENKDMQDQILLKADGYPTYNFAHVVDDYLMGVTHVVRGSEYLTSTPKYVLLYDAFGWERPKYVHLPLLMGKDADGKVSKLSKRHGAVSFQDLVKNGYLPGAIVNYIALLGWCPKNENREIFSLSELRELFSIEGINKSPAVFDYEKLRWFNSEYIKAMPDADYEAEVLPVLSALCPAGTDVRLLASLLHTRLACFGDVPQTVGFVLKRLPIEGDVWTNKKNKTTPEGCLAILREVLPLLETADDWTNDALFEKLGGYAAAAGIKAGAVMWAVRIAVARQTVTPGGATELMVVLGKKESLARIELAISELYRA
ncbi:MAG: glutamate--tRNA ligase [Clostridia bacterium]|nr:glutamate--tRNA ligase [Clostridia bacterium]